MKKWIIGGAIVGIVAVIVAHVISFTFSDLIFNLPQEEFWVWESRFQVVMRVLCPFGDLTMDIDPELTPNFFRWMYILGIFLSICLYAFLGYILGRIIRRVRQK